MKEINFQTLRQKKKGQLNFILPAFLTVGIAVIGVSMIAAVLGGVRDAQTANSAEYNVTVNGLTGLAQVNNFWSPIFLVVIAVVIIGLLGLFGRGGRGRGL